MRKLCFLTAILLFTSCATIIHGSRQDVSLSTTPTGAVIIIDGMNKGRTPNIVCLDRKNTHTVSIQLTGYLPFETNIIKKVDGWFIGNILFGGLIGLIIDAATGSMYRLTPDQIDMEMKNSTVALHDNMIYIGIVMQPKPEWELIGYLQRDK